MLDLGPMSFIDEDLTFFSQKPLANVQQNLNVSLWVQVNENSTFSRSHDQDGCHADIGQNTLKIFFPGTTGQILMKLCIKHQRPNPLIMCANYDPGLTLTYFTASSDFCNLGFYIGKCDNDGFFGNYCIL